MRRIFALLIAMALSVMWGCSGGGGSSAAPQPVVTPGGAGTAAVFNVKITFMIDVPPGSSATSTSARRRAVSLAAAAATATSIATTPYVSPLTGSVLLTLAEVDGVSPQQAPPAIAPVNVPPSCQGSNSGCTIPVSNVPAALGVDRYFVQTYTGVNATGSVISTGFVDVSVPVKPHGSPSVGGAALSIGGYAATIELAPASIEFVLGTPGSANILVQALDAAGATIIGPALYATPITVTLTDAQNFALNGSPSVTVNGPLSKPLTLQYSGGTSFGTLVKATSLDGSGSTVAASPIPVTVLPPGSTPTSPPPVIKPTPGSSPTPPGSSPTPTPAPTAIPSTLPTAVPTPKPTPTKPQTQPLSLYVADGQADTVSEYRIASQIAAGAIPNPTVTPSRVIGFVPSLATSPAIGSGGLACSAAQGSPTGNGNGTAGLSVDPTSGKIFILPNCTDGVNSFVFAYPAQAVGTPAPTVVDPFPALAGQPEGLALANGFVYAGYAENNNAVYGFGVQSNGQQPSVSIGSNCFAEFGNPSPGCFNYSDGSGFGVDENGFLYVPAYWEDAPPPQDDASAFQQPPAVLVVPASGSNATLTPYTAIAGLNTTVGGSEEAPVASTVDAANSTLYVLANAQTLNSNSGTTSYWPGLSNCPPPSANAPINQGIPIGTEPPTLCADAQSHIYLAAFNITGQLLGPAADGRDVDLIPNFLIGGDTVGDFGCQPNYFGQYLAASGGFVYVINQNPTCPSANPVLAPEIDVYNINGLSGAFTNVGPVFRLPLQTGYPTAIAIGPSGTVVGGQALLRRPLSRPYRGGLYVHRWRAPHKPHRL